MFIIKLVQDLLLLLLLVFYYYTLRWILYFIDNLSDSWTFFWGKTKQRGNYSRSRSEIELGHTRTIRLDLLVGIYSWVSCPQMTEPNSSTLRRKQINFDRVPRCCTVVLGFSSNSDRSMSRAVLVVLFIVGDAGSVDLVQKLALSKQRAGSDWNCFVVWK